LEEGILLKFSRNDAERVAKEEGRTILYYTVAVTLVATT
jgi:hypothetical protein